MVDYCIAELRWRTQLFKKHGFVVAFEGDVVKSDSAISPKLKDELKAAVMSLENVPDKYKDWHPGSDEKVTLCPTRAVAFADRTVGPGSCSPITVSSRLRKDEDFAR